MDRALLGSGDPKDVNTLVRVKGHLSPRGKVREAKVNQGDRKALELPDLGGHCHGVKEITHMGVQQTQQRLLKEQQIIWDPEEEEEEEEDLSS